MVVGNSISIGWMEYETEKTFGGSQVFIPIADAPVSPTDAINIVTKKMISLASAFPGASFIRFTPSEAVQE